MIPISILLALLSTPSDTKSDTQIYTTQLLARYINDTQIHTQLFARYKTDTHIHATHLLARYKNHAHIHTTRILSTHLDTESATHIHTESGIQIHTSHVLETHKNDTHIHTICTFINTFRYKIGYPNLYFLPIIKIEK